MKPSFLIVALAIVMIPLCAARAQQATWKAPASADTLHNPFGDTPAMLALGQKVFKQNCVTCHGPKGKGNGPAAVALNPRPANLTAKAVQSQTEGDLFWKVETGHLDMPSWQASLSKKQVWSVVTYIKNSLSSKHKH
jgi:mono/diheme cytochrome c family protein